MVGRIGLLSFSSHVGVEFENNETGNLFGYLTRLCSRAAVHTPTLFQTITVKS